MKFSFIYSTTELKSITVTLSTLLIPAVCRTCVIHELSNLVEHRSAKREGLGFVRFLVEDSSSLMLLLFYS